MRFQFNLMTRSKRITYDNLAARDPELIAEVNRAYADLVGAPPTSEGRPPPPVFTRLLQLLRPRPAAAGRLPPASG